MRPAALALIAAAVAAPALAQPAPAYILRQGNGTATLLDRAHVRREGQIATITSMLIYAEPVRSNETDWFWNDSRDDFDCQAHAYRSEADAKLTLTRDKAQALNDPDASEDWTPVDAGSLTAKEEALACKGDTAGLTPVPDLKAFAEGFASKPKAP